MPWPARSPRHRRAISSSSPILKGSFIFAADLIRALHREGLKPEIDFIFLASYGAGTVSGGEVKVLRDVETELAGREVVIVDDILDSGRTLPFAKTLLERTRRAAGQDLRPDRQASAARRRDRAGLRRASAARRSSWWATAWTSPTAIASCPSSARSEKP